MAKVKSDEVFSFAEELAAGEVPSGRKLQKQQASYRTYSTGSFMLDLAIGEKDPITGLPGIPERAIVEIFGINQSGKSLTAEHLMKNVLDADPENLVVAIYGEEPDIDRLTGIGIDLDRVAMLFSYEDLEAKNQMAEQFLDKAKRAVQDPHVKLVIIDSIKSLCSVRQLFDDRGKITDLDDSEQLAIRARLIGEFLRDFKNLNKRAILFMTNQMSEKIARGPWDNPQNPQYNIRTPGGTAMEFEAHIRIHAQCRPILSKNKHPLTGKELLIGWEVCYRLVKNKFSKKTGNRVANSDFYFDPPGFRRATEIFNVAEFLGIIQRTGTSIYLIGKDKIRGRDAALEFLHSKPELCKKLEAEIIERAEEVFSDIEGEEDKVSAQF